MNVQQYSKAIMHASEIMPEDREYHNVEHAKTVRDEVTRLAHGECDPHDIKLLQIAAMYHDTGYRNSHENHEERSSEIAKEKMEEIGFSEEEIQTVVDCIMSTDYLAEPESELGAYLADADVWNFGAKWDVFEDCTERVRKEFAPSVAKEEWFAFRGHMLREHEFETEAAINKYQKQKEKNADIIEDKYGIITERPWVE